ncbi:MAG: 30S ribosome-binding factor RbfA [Rhodospirillales bacterium]|nr:30S ribosome-binding factor RbfA [Rhodospirillales bacterium]
MVRRDARGPSQRQLRVGEELRHALAWMLERGEVRDPGLQGISVTVTEVQVSPDLRSATAYVLPLGGSETEPVVAALTRASPFIRRRIAETVRLRFVPALAFSADNAFARATRIEDLLRQSEAPAAQPDAGALPARKRGRGRERGHG